MRNSARIRNLLGVATIVGGTLGLIPGAAQAAPIALVGDDTTLEAALGFNALAAAGITLQPLGAGTTNAIGEIILPITGGSVELAYLEATILHQTSGLELRRGADYVAFTNIEVDLTNLVVMADVSASAGLPLLQAQVFGIAICPLYGGFDPCYERDGSVRIDNYGLRATSGAAAVIGQAFGLTAGEVLALETGAHVALAEFDLRPVPEPGTLLLLGGALAGLAAAGRRR